MEKLLIEIADFRKEPLLMSFYSGLNQEIKEYGGVSLKQSINVR